MVENLWKWIIALKSWENLTWKRVHTWILINSQDWSLIDWSIDHWMFIVDFLRNYSCDFGELKSIGNKEWKRFCLISNLFEIIHFRTIKNHWKLHQKNNITLLWIYAKIVENWWKWIKTLISWENLSWKRLHTLFFINF